jgi:uncharacterized membrane protein YphA (DoxX/SURF4 family)
MAGVVPSSTARPALRVAIWAARGLVVLVFAYAAVEKIADPAGFAKSIRGYALFPEQLSNVLAICVPWVEIIAAFLLLIGIWRREARLLIGALLIAFIAMKAIVLAQGRKLDCGCFGAHSVLSKLTEGKWGILLNVVLLACLVIEALGERRLQPPGSAPEPRTARDA